MTEQTAVTHVIQPPAHLKKRLLDVAHLFKVHHHALGELLEFRQGVPSSLERLERRQLRPVGHRSLVLGVHPNLLKAVCVRAGVAGWRGGCRVGGEGCKVRVGDRSSHHCWLQQHLRGHVGKRGGRAGVGGQAGRIRSPGRRSIGGARCGEKKKKRRHARNTANLSAHDAAGLASRSMIV